MTLTIEQLVRDIVEGRILEARQWVADAMRSMFRVDKVQRPKLGSDFEMSVAAGVTELLADRLGQRAPAWTSKIGGLSEPEYLGNLKTFKRSREFARLHGPEPLRRRNVIATQDFLTIQ
jgi:hypothetical protein